MPLPLPDKPSIAVLPFQNMSGDPEQEYFVDGLVEDIITGLSRFKSLFVIARNSSFAYKGKSLDIRQVGRELGVRYVLEGSVRKAGNRLRITGQLIDASDGAHLWADRFEGALEDVFELQDRVTVRVVGDRAKAGAGRNRARHANRPRVCAPMTVICAAWPRSTQASPATRRKPVDCAARPSNWTRTSPPRTRWPRIATPCSSDAGSNPDRAAVAETLRLAQRAVELDRNDPLVLTRSAWAQAHVIRDLETAAGQVELALTLNPNLALAWAISGWNPGVAGRTRAWASTRRPCACSRSIRISGSGLRPLAHAYFMAGRNDEAWSSAERAVWQWPFPPAYRIAAAAAAVSGRSEEAARFVNLLLAVDPERRVSNLVGVLGPY